METGEEKHCGLDFSGVSRWGLCLSYFGLGYGFEIGIGIVAVPGAIAE